MAKDSTRSLIADAEELRSKRKGEGDAEQLAGEADALLQKKPAPSTRQILTESEQMLGRAPQKKSGGLGIVLLVVVLGLVGAYFLFN